MKDIDKGSKALSVLDCDATKSSVINDILKSKILNKFLVHVWLDADTSESVVWNGLVKSYNL